MARTLDEALDMRLTSEAETDNLAVYPRIACHVRGLSFSRKSRACLREDEAFVEANPSDLLCVHQFRRTVGTYSTFG